MTPQDRSDADSNAEWPILIALGANLPSQAGPPEVTLAAALGKLEEQGVAVTVRSRIWRTRPVPDDGQPWFFNAAAQVETSLDSVALLALLHEIENEFGRRRVRVNGPRTLDLDLLAYRGLVRAGPEAPILPHPRMAERAFVLLPLAEVAPDWIHPISGWGIEELLAFLPAGDVEMAEPIAG